MSAEAFFEKIKARVPSARQTSVLNHLKGMDELNLLYFEALYQQKINPRQKEKLRIDDGSPRSSDELAAYPTAIAPKELLKQLPYVQYEDLWLKEDLYKNLARTCRLWMKKTQAGGGTSILRTLYLSRKLSKPVEKIKLGAKGTDLFVNMAALAELQILQSVFDLKEKKIDSVFFQDLVSSESQEAIHEFWKKPSSTEALKTPGFNRFNEIFQWLLPTLDQQGQFTLERQAPGGHAFFAVDALLSACRDSRRPDSAGAPLIAVVGNGEDLGSSPDPAMIGWMLERQAAIVMITTEKTRNDLKGGQIALVEDGAGQVFAALIEQAQAKQAGQLALFESLGLDFKNPGQMALFNTNTALFNYQILAPKIKKLVEEIGEGEFLKIITPTLIENKKTQKDAQGRTVVFEQLEGAMGSSLLNLDRYWRERYKEPLVHFINVSRAHRTRFFSPVKTAFDFFMLFHSDRFALDIPSMRLKNLGPDTLPEINLTDPADKNFYLEVQNVLDCFSNTKIRDLESLSVRGKVSFAGMTLKGRVHVESEASASVSLAKKFSGESSVLEDKKISISEKGDVNVVELRNEKK